MKITPTQRAELIEQGKLISVHGRWFIDVDAVDELLPKAEAEEEKPGGRKDSVEKQRAS